MIVAEFRQFRPVTVSMTMVIMLWLSLLFSNHLAGHDLIATTLFAGYVLLILTFITSFYLACTKLPWFLSAFIIVTIGAAFVSGLFSIGFYFFLDYQPLIEQRLYALGRLNNPVISAISYGSILCLCLTFIATTRENGLRALALVIAITLIIAILLTGSRGAWVGILGATFCIIVLRDWKSRQQFIASLIALPIILTSLGAVLYSLGYADALVRRSFSFRPEIWQATVEHWLSSSLLFGAGLNSKIDLAIPPNVFEHPHSIYISTLYYGGLISLTLLSILLARAYWVLINRAEKNTRNYAFPLLTFGLMTLVFDGNRLIEKVDFLWLCLWLPITLTLVAEGKFSERPSQVSVG